MAWRRLGRFLGLRASGWSTGAPLQELLARRFNSGVNRSSRGAFRVEGEAARQASRGTYEASGGVPMLGATRGFIYRREQAACEAIRAEFDVELWRNCRATAI